MTTGLIILCAVIGYGLGAIPTGLWVARAYGVNIREQGSGNIGATNVLRAVGKVPALLVVLADPLKSFVAVILARLLGLEPWGLAVTAFASIIGNNFNVFLGFRGGKGIATSLGAFFALSPLTALCALILGLGTIVLGRLVSLGSLIGSLSVPLLLWYKGSSPLAYIILGLAIFALAMLRHRQNLERLAKGNERRIGVPATSARDAEDVPAT